MQSDRELMQQALEALDCLQPSAWEISDRMGADTDKTITALRERLAQPEQDWDWRHPKAQALIGAKARLQIKLRLVEQLLEDPNLETTASDMEYWEPLHDKLQERLAQPEQEPVAWVTGWHDGHCVIRAANPAAILPIGIALYTTPPRREWVSVTEAEIKALPQWYPSHETAAALPLIRAVEAKLKQRNT